MASPDIFSHISHVLSSPSLITLSSFVKGSSATSRGLGGRKERGEEGEEKGEGEEEFIPNVADSGGKGRRGGGGVRGE
jgi:hypothetical protein